MTELTKRTSFLKVCEEEQKQGIASLIGLCTLLLRVLFNGTRVKATVAEWPPRQPTVS